MHGVRHRATTDVSDNGDFEDLVAAHQEAVWRYLRFLGAEPEQARDLLQETFLAVWQKPFEQRSERATRRYLSTVARNKFLMEKRQGRARLSFATIEDADVAWESHADDGGGAYIEALAHCLDVLPERSRTALEMRYGSSASRAEIAARLGMGAEGLKTLLRRVRDGLRDCIQRRLAT